MKNTATLREGIAFVLALILWVFVRTTHSGLSSETLVQMQMMVPIKVEKQSEKLVTYDVSQATARITVQGDDQAISSLREQQITAFVDLGGDEAASMWPKVQVIVPGIVKLVSVEPEVINVKQAPVGAKRVPVKVQISGEAAKGRTPGTPVPSEKDVVVSGPQPLLDEVTHVRARVMLSGQSQSSSFELRDLVPVNAEAQVVEARRASLEVQPSSLWVTVPIEAESRSVAVAVSLNNVRVQKLAGYHTTLEVVPEFVTLRITREQTAPEFVLTHAEVFPPSSKVESRDVPLDIPDGMEVVGSSTVRVRCIPTPIAKKPPHPHPPAGASPTPQAALPRIAPWRSEGNRYATLFWN